MGTLDLNYSRKIGSGGENAPMEIITHGEKRVEVLAGHPAMKGQPSASSPPAPTNAGEGTWFFRNDGAGKSQFCVRFPSGVVQIISTEP